jgi:hypothetical protein
MCDSLSPPLDSITHAAVECVYEFYVEAMMSTEPDAFVQSLNQPELDFVIVADRAEVVNGKLYMMGGGYDRIYLSEEPPRVFSISFVVGVLVPWNACNQEHRLDFAVEDSEGQALDFSARATFNVGRSPHMEPGEVQRVMLAPPQVAVTFPVYGSYFLRVTLNEAISKKVALYVSGAKGVAIRK